MANIVVPIIDLSDESFLQKRRWKHNELLILILRFFINRWESSICMTLSITRGWSPEYSAVRSAPQAWSVIFMSSYYRVKLYAGHRLDVRWVSPTIHENDLQGAMSFGILKIGLNNFQSCHLVRRTISVSRRWFTVKAHSHEGSK